MKTYNPKKVNLVLGGFLVTGYADGTFIKLKWNNPELFKRHIGGQGEVTRTERVDTSGTIEISLMQTSPAHTFLHNLAKLKGTFPVLQTYKGDNNFAAAGPNAWVEKMPDEESATEVSKRDWVIAVEDMSMITI